MVCKAFSVLIFSVFVLLVVVLLVSGCAAEKTTSKDLVRFALFNIWEMSIKKLTDVDASGIGQNDQLRAAAEILRKINPDVLVLNEIDHDIGALHYGKDL